VAGVYGPKPPLFVKWYVHKIHLCYCYSPRVRFCYYNFKYIYIYIAKQDVRKIPSISLSKPLEPELTTGTAS
jgi:hypothetical protein